MELIEPRIGEYVYGKRIRMGMTAEHLAKISDVPVAVVVGFELGWMGLEPVQAQRILQVLGLDLDDISNHTHD